MFTPNKHRKESNALVIRDVRLALGERPSPKWCRVSRRAREEKFCLTEDIQHSCGHPTRKI